MSGNVEERVAGGGGRTALTVVGVVLCLVLAPILVLNCVLIARSYLDPDSVPAVGGASPLIVMSDSMYPEIQKGDLIVCRSVEPAELGEGDVIAFYDPEAQTDITVVTHRIVGVTEQDGELAFVTRGDANDSDDLHPTLASDVIGVVDARLPGLGDAAMFMQSTPGLVVCVALPVVLLVLYDVVRTRLYQRRARDGAAELMAELEALRAERATAGVAPGGESAGAAPGGEAPGDAPGGKLGGDAADGPGEPPSDGDAEGGERR